MQRKRSWHKKVSEMSVAGCKPEEIAIILKNTSLLEVLESIKNYSNLKNWYVASLHQRAIYFGNKNESYMTEEEMLCNELPTYNYKSLSYAEKRIYNNESWKN